MTAVVAPVYLAVVAGAGVYLLYFELLNRVGPIKVILIEYAVRLLAALSVGLFPRSSCCTDDGRLSDDHRWLCTHQISNYRHRAQSENRDVRQLAMIIRSPKLLLDLIEDRLERLGLDVPA